MDITQRFERCIAGSTPARPIMHAIDYVLVMIEEYELRLLPCPFCGGQARILPQEYGLSVDCKVCKGMTKVIWPDLQDDDMGAALEQALANWNHRYDHKTGIRDLNLQ